MFGYSFDAFEAVILWHCSKRKKQTLNVCMNNIVADELNWQGSQHGIAIKLHINSMRITSLICQRTSVCQTTPGPHINVYTSICWIMDNSYPRQLVPKTTRTQGYELSWVRVVQIPMCFTLQLPTKAIYSLGHRWACRCLINQQTVLGDQQALQSWVCVSPLWPVIQLYFQLCGGWMWLATAGNAVCINGLCAWNSPVTVESSNKEPAMRPMMFSLILGWTSCWTNSRLAGDWDKIVMVCIFMWYRVPVDLNLLMTPYGVGDLGLFPDCINVDSESVRLSGIHCMKHIRILKISIPNLRLKFTHL